MEYQRIYFIGIGGIGMSAIARYFNQRGVQIFGYDRTESKLTKQLEEEGMQIHYEDDIQQIPEGINLVVYTPAIPKHHAELNWFIDNNYPVKKRAEVLGIISRSQKCVAVAGTHGKTTTSTIVTHLLREGGVDCTAFLGGIARNFDSNYVHGESEWVVVEADEYDRSFLHLQPEIAILTSVDADHLDIYGDEKEMRNTFARFVANIRNEGQLIIKQDLPLPLDEEVRAKFDKKTYGAENADYEIKKVRPKEGYFMFDLKTPSGEMLDLKFTLPGYHNLLNATAAIIVALKLGVSESDLRKGLQSFKGIWRRFEFIVREGKTVFIDDYAHHPSELEAAIDAAKALYPNKKLTGVFQPHLYTRTRDFADGFAAALDALDEVILLPIYPARELPIEGVESEMLLEKMQNENAQLVQKADLVAHISESRPEVLLTLGAGDIDRLIEPLRELLITDY